MSTFTQRKSPNIQSVRASNEYKINEIEYFIPISYDF